MGGGAHLERRGLLEAELVEPEALPLELLLA
jgi:hypothetical protein